MKDRFEIVLENVSASDASSLADDLAIWLATSFEDAEASVAGGDPDAMDFGATVVLLVGTPAFLAVARGLADWIKRQGDPDLVIKTKAGSVSVRGGLDSAAKREIVLAALQGRGV